MDKLVSVIIPAYNVQPYLCKALDSVLGQTYPNLEILVIDDGSDDGSESICDEYGRKDARITVIHQKNMGLSTARNVDLNRMTGEIVAFLDPDDAFHPDMIRRLLDAMNRNDAEIAVCGISRYHTAGRMEGERSFLRSDYQREQIFDKREAMAELTEDRIAGCVWNKLYTADLWSAMRFPDGHVYEDIHTMYRIMGNTQHIVTVPGCPVRHRIRPGSITRTRSVQNTRDWMRARKQTEDYIQENTPKVFSAQMLTTVQNQTLRGMIVFYMGLKTVDRGYAKALREEIMDRAGKDNGTAWDVRTRAACQMLRLCPWTIPLTLPVYRFFRQLYLGITGQQVLCLFARMKKE